MPMIEYGADELMAQIGDTFGSMLQEDERQPAHKRTKGQMESHQGTSGASSSEPIVQALQLLTTLTLRQEGYIQSLQTTDTFLMFLQFAPSGIVPQLMKKSQEWKQSMENRTAKQALKNVLFQTIVQQLQDRFLRIATSKVGSEIWKEGITHQVITEHGSWPYLAWNPKEKRLVPTDKTALSMTTMQSLIEELVEIASQGESVLRLKSLKPESRDGAKPQVSPWLLQLHPRKERIHEILMLLTASSIWCLVMGRVRPHINKENHAAAQLIKVCNSLSKRKP